MTAITNRDKLITNYDNYYKLRQNIPSLTSFHSPFYYNVFDQRLFCFYEKLFQPVHKNIIKIKI